MKNPGYFKDYSSGLREDKEFYFWFLKNRVTKKLLARMTFWLIFHKFVRFFFFGIWKKPLLFHFSLKFDASQLVISHIGSVKNFIAENRFTTAGQD